MSKVSDCRSLGHGFEHNFLLLLGSSQVWGMCWPAAGDSVAYSQQGMVVDRPGLPDLPQELLEIVFSHLADPVSLRRVSQVCN